MLTSGTVYTVLDILGCQLVHEAAPFRVYQYLPDGADPEFFVVALARDVAEEALCNALENIGIASAAIHEALRQCGH